LAGGKLYTYAANTTTPQATYTDQVGGTPNANPVVLDANGEANVWLATGVAYKFVLKNSSDVTQWTVDQVSSVEMGGVPAWNPTTNYPKGSIVQDSTGEGILYVSLQDNSLNHALTETAWWRSYDGTSRTVTTNTSIAISDNLVRSNSTSGDITHTLPLCSTTPVGKKVTVKDVGTGGFATTLKGSGTDLVDGINTYATTLNQYESILVMNNGTSWDVIG
jgi:hypothetical protein